MKEGLAGGRHSGFIFEAGIVYCACDFEDGVLQSLLSSLCKDLAALCLLNTARVCVCRWVTRDRKNGGRADVRVGGWVGGRKWGTRGKGR